MEHKKTIHNPNAEIIAIGASFGMAASYQIASIHEYSMHPYDIITNNISIILISTIIGAIIAKKYITK